MEVFKEALPEEMGNDFSLVFLFTAKVRKERPQRPGVQNLIGGKVCVIGNYGSDYSMLKKELKYEVIPFQELRSHKVKKDFIAFRMK